MPTNEGPPSEDKYLSDSASRSSSEAGQHSDKPYKGEKPPETALAPSVSSPGDVTRSGSAASSELGLLSNGTQPREAAPLEPNEMRPSLEGRLASGVVPVDIHATDLRWDADEEDLDGALHDVRCLSGRYPFIASLIYRNVAMFQTNIYKRILPIQY